MTFILDHISSNLPLLQNMSKMVLDALLKTISLVSYILFKVKGHDCKGPTWDFEIKTEHENGLNYSFSSSRAPTLCHESALDKRRKCWEKY